jgi:hypothetical protein
MPKKMEGASEHHFRCSDEDWQFLLQRYGPRSRNPIGVAEFIRQLVSATVRRSRALEANALDGQKESQR